MAGRFANRNILITGAASGIGAATARRVAAEGATVILVDIDVAGVQKVLNAINDDSPDSFIIETDLADPVSIDAMGEQVASRVKAVHGVVNSAGVVIGGGKLQEATAEMWRKGMAINLEATPLVMRAVLDLMKAGGASVVNISSDGGLHARPRMVIYDATKAALISVSKSLAAELVGFGIRVNALAPGWTATEFHVREGEDVAARLKELEELETRYCLMRRLGRVDEIAAAIAFLLSDDASFITGATLCVDGGRVGHAIG